MSWPAPYFTLQRGAHHGDPISAFLFILSLGISFLSIKKNSDIQGIEILNHCYLYPPYAGDTANHRVVVIETFSQFSNLKPNISKREITGINALKRVPMTVCDVKSLDLTTDLPQILGICFSYNKK